MSAPGPDTVTPTPGPESEAADWFALRRSRALTAEEAAAFEAWLAREPEHRAAYDNLDFYWHAAAAVRDDPEVLAMRDEADRTWGRRRAGVLSGAIAASLLAAVIVGVAVFGPGAPGRLFKALSPGQQTFHTAVGQTTTVMLPDGTAVTLDTDTKIRTRQDGHERFVEMEKGRAFFRVAHDASRPFKVLAAGRTVTALGTVFEVRADPARFEVTLVEGRVRVEEPKKAAAPPQATELAPGSQLVARDEKRWSVAETDVDRETSWLRGRLTFDNEPLGEVVREMNRYSDKKIVIEDAAVAGAPVLGVFKAGDVDGFVRAVEAYHLARIVESSDSEVSLGAPS